MSKVIEFRRADMAEASDLSTVRLQRQDSLVGKADGEAVADRLLITIARCSGTCQLAYLPRCGCRAACTLRVSAG